jgi:hypothetical protein
MILDFGLEILDKVTELISDRGKKSGDFAQNLKSKTD